MRKQITARCAECASSYQKGKSGSFNFDKLKFIYKTKKVCPSCTTKRLKEYYERCKSLKLIKSPEISGSISIDWKEYYKLRNNVGISNMFLRVLASLKLVSVKFQKNSETEYFSVLEKDELKLFTNLKYARIVFRHQSDAADWAMACGSSVVKYDSNWQKVPNRQVPLSAHG